MGKKGAQGPNYIGFTNPERVRDALNCQGTEILGQRYETENVHCPSNKYFSFTTKRNFILLNASINPFPPPLHLGWSCDTVLANETEAPDPLWALGTMLFKRRVTGRAVYPSPSLLCCLECDPDARRGRNHSGAMR